MCKHILNAQASVRAPCCRKWYDCPECHDEDADHPLKRVYVLVFGCKKCKKVFRKDMQDFDEDVDGFCPHCDNEYLVEPKRPEQPQLMVQLEGSADMVRDSRVKPKHQMGGYMQSVLSGYS